VARALAERVGEVMPAGAWFDAGDAVIFGNRRLIFVWNLGKRWVVATEHGGFIYNNPIFAFDLSEDGRRATFVQERIVSPDSVCSIAPSLLEKVPAKNHARWRGES
jgi:hypothetical protein